MREEELGKEGENQARLILKSMGFEVQQLDWVGIKNGQTTCFEIKKKERFTPPPFEGHGLDKRQIYLRNKLFENTSIRTMLMIFEIPSGRIFYRYLDLLEKGKKFETINGVIIYPLSSFFEKI